MTWTMTDEPPWWADDAAEQRAQLRLANTDEGSRLVASQAGLAASVQAVSGRDSLFCWAVTQSSGNELELMKYQFSRRTGIFACDSWLVFSDVQIPVSPSPPWLLTTVLNVSLRAPVGKVEHIANAPIFMAAWQQVHNDPRYFYSDWIVKVDPDTVFMPSRLRGVLGSFALGMGDAGEPANLYLLGCFGSFGLFGAIEVVSQRATQAYFKNIERCRRELQYDEWGEDLFLRKCLDLLEIQSKYAPGLLGDGYCNAKYFNQPCSDTKAAFHPYKTVKSYATCLDEMESAGYAAKEDSLTTLQG